jgi:AcrR family transcriptional regulator
LAKIKKSARKLFVERGYHATRPQDIAREAGLGHGTFYLHYEDKRACFLAFVEDARTELQHYISSRLGESRSLEYTIVTTLNAIYEYSESHPGVLNAAMTDEAVIDAEGAQAVPLLLRWGRDWAEIIRRAMDNGTASRDYDADIIGQVIIGALHQTGSEGYRSGRTRQEVVDNLTRFLVRALKP